MERKADALALDEFRAVEQLSPEVPGLFSEIGAAYAGLGQKTLALKAYERALDIDPNDVAANYYLARLNWVEGNYTVSGDYLAKARQAAPEDPLVQLLSAEVSIHTQDYAQARPLLEKVVRELPENIRAHVLLSQVYIHLQQVDEAKREEAIAKALQESAEKQREQTMRRHVTAYRVSGTPRTLRTPAPRTPSAPLAPAAATSNTSGRSQSCSLMWTGPHE